MTRRVFYTVATLIAIATVHARAQTPWPPAVFSPAAPTNMDQIRADFTAPGGCDLDATTTVSGTIVRTDVTFTGCIVGPPPIEVPTQAFFGPLPANTYMYEIYFLFEGDAPVLRSQQPLVVAAAAEPIPLTSGAGTVLLLLLIAATGLVALARSGV